jgi:S-adenosylmethionine/arginine decarboxylase-like enzyme
MEIIKQGKIPDEHLYGTCGYCKSEIKANHDELSMVYDQRDGTLGSGECPVCQRLMNFYPRIRNKRYYNN